MLGAYHDCTSLLFDADDRAEYGAACKIAIAALDREIGRVGIDREERIARRDGTFEDRGLEIARAELAEFRRSRRHLMALMVELATVSKPVEVV